MLAPFQSVSEKLQFLLPSQPVGFSIESAPLLEDGKHGTWVGRGAWSNDEAIISILQKELDDPESFCHEFHGTTFKNRQEDIEKMKFEINRAGTHIALVTRRGSGNTWLFHPNNFGWMQKYVAQCHSRMLENDRHKRLIPWKYWPEDVIVSFYKGSSNYDSPFFECEDGIFFQRDWKKYVRFIHLPGPLGEYV
jgi:hypothetical protein